MSPRTLKLGPTTSAILAAPSPLPPPFTLKLLKKFLLSLHPSPTGSLLLVCKRRVQPLPTTTTLSVYQSSVFRLGEDLPLQEGD